MFMNSLLCFGCSKDNGACVYDGDDHDGGGCAAASHKYRYMLGGRQYQCWFRFLFFCADPWIMIVGGDTGTGTLLRDVELLSLDEKNHPVPTCLKKLADYPSTIEDLAGGLLPRGMYDVPT